MVEHGRVQARNEKATTCRTTSLPSCIPSTSPTWCRVAGGLEFGAGSIGIDAGAATCLRRQACSCPSHSDVLIHAWHQACAELCLLGRKGGLHIRLSHRIVHHAMAKQLPLS